MHTESASFGAGRKSLLPPTKSFSFSESHNRDDKGFQTYLSEAVGIDSNQAEQFVTKFSNNVVNGLNSKKPVELAYVGILKKEEGNRKIEFLQNSMTLAKINNLLPEVNLPEPRAVGDRPKMEIPVPEGKPAKAPTPSKTPVAGEPSTKPSTKQPGKKQPVTQATPAFSRVEEPKERGCWPWIVGALLLGALLVFGIKMCSKDDAGPYLTKDPQAIVTEEGAATASEGSTATVDAGATTETENDNAQIEGADTSTSTTTTTGSSMPEDCIVIVASMQNQRNISRLKNKVRERNYELYTESHGAYTRVGMRIACDALPGSYKDYIRKISNEFDVNAWSLSPEFPQ